MGKNSDIEWLKAWPGGGHSKSAWWGCTPAGPECKHCYAAAIALRFRGIEYRKGGLRARIGGFERSVRQMDDRAERTGERPLVFWSVSDPFDTEVPQGWFDAAWDVIARAKNLRWILLTKRPQHIRNRIRESVYSKLYVNPLAMVAHVSFGISAGTNDGFWER